MKKILTIIFILGSLSSLAAESDEAINTGFIFSVDNLLDLQSYEGGIGFKIGKDQIYGRGMVDFFFTTQSSAMELEGLAAFEYHFTKNRISPYIGIFGAVGYNEIKTTDIDEENWEKTTYLPIKVGPFVGAEFYIFEYFSIFAEYAITGSFTKEQSVTSANGIETQGEENWVSTVSAGLGNGAKIGIVFYF